MLRPLAPREDVEALSALLRSSIGLSDQARSQRVLTGLRSLRDPATLPLFAQLSINPEPGLRVQGLLGLAELEPRRGLDLLGVLRIREPRLQGIIVSEAMALGLIDDETMSELSGWTSLPARVRVELAASCAGRGRAFSVGTFQGLLEDPDAFTSVAAAVVLKQAGVRVPQEEMLLRSKRGALTAGVGEQARLLARLVLRANLTMADEALRTVSTDVRGQAAREVTAARLLASPDDPSAVLAARRRLDIATPVSERAAFALLMLEAAASLGPQMPPVLVQELVTDPDTLVKAMGGAVNALANEPAAVGRAVAVLARIGDPPSVEWALRMAELTHWENARTIRLAVAEGIARRAKGSAIDPRLAELASRAVARLVDDQPRELDRPLAEAMGRSDDPLVRIMLEGVLRSVHPQAGALVRQGTFEARPQGPWPSPAAASLAVLVAVRHDEFTADPTQRIERLTSIARDQSSDQALGDVARAKAAWLALRATGEHRVALARILSDLPAPESDTPAWTDRPAPLNPTP